MNKILLALMFLSAFSSAIAQPSNTKSDNEPIQTPVVLTASVEATECCKHYFDLIKTTLPLVFTKISIDEKTSVFNFAKKSQSYVLFELPEYTQPYSLIVHNFPVAPGIFNSSSYTQIPLRIETFDSDFKSKRIYKHTEMKKHGIGFDKTVFINPQNKNERYILIYGDIEAGVEEITISKTDVVFVGTGFFIGGEDKKISVAASDKGLISVDVKGLIVAK
jgi:hypothetical protein